MGTTVLSTCPGGIGILFLRVGCGQAESEPAGKQTGACGEGEPERREKGPVGGAQMRPTAKVEGLA